MSKGSGTTRGSSQKTSVPTLPSEEANRAYLRPFLNKRYAVAQCDGKIDEVMRALGVGALRRAMFSSSMQRLELTENKGVYTLHVHFAFRTMRTTFRIGEEVDDMTPNRIKARSIFYQDKSTLTQIVRCQDKTLVIIREFVLQPEQILVTLKLDNIVAKRVYKPFSTVA